MAAEPPAILERVDTMVMPIGELLVAAGLASPKQIEAAVKRQNARGGRLEESLIESGAVDRTKLDGFLRRVPREPASIAETGIPEHELLNHLLKVIYTGHLDTIDRFVEAIGLPHHVVVVLTQSLVDQRLLAAAGVRGRIDASAVRYSLSEDGRRRAIEALQQSQYSGPAPVSIEAFAERIQLQKTTDRKVDAKTLKAALSDMVIDASFVERLGPAVNSARAVLLYGMPGNGKTSIALRLQKVFSDVIFVPHAVMVEGQVMRVYDPSLHRLPELPGGRTTAKSSVIRSEQHDARWVASQRPFVITGGELTLEMLDLSYNPTANFYEAPLHVKALGGCFIVDDFGRQLVSATKLLNRWIVPLESRVDYLKLQTGKSFSIPFEEKVIFSTNIEPEDFMEPAFLRRIPYKLEVCGPTPEQFRLILEAVAKAAKLKLSDDVHRAIVDGITKTRGMKLACYHPQFIVDQVLAACEFAQQPPSFEPRFIDYAIDNLKVRRSDATVAPSTQATNAGPPSVTREVSAA